MRIRYLEELRTAVGAAAIITDPAAIAGFIEDNSWLSPLLTEYFSGRRAVGGLPLVQAVVSPEDADSLKAVLQIAFREEIPVTVRGGGTSNFGQVIPTQGGIIVDIKRLNRMISVTEDAVTAQAGALVGTILKKVQRQGKDLTVFTTTYASATVGGWICGGHVGIGSNAYGTIWDGNVDGVHLMTAEQEPRELHLTGDAVFPALHTYGTVGVVTEVTLPLVPARRWVELVGVFEKFEDACHFTMAMNHELVELQRVVNAQEAPIPTGLKPLRDLVEPHQSAVLMIVDEQLLERGQALARDWNGRMQVWRAADGLRGLSFTYMVYGHRMLWVKALAPKASFLHVYFHPEHAMEQVQALRRRYRGHIWLELKYINSPYLCTLFGFTCRGPLPAAVITVVSEVNRLGELMEYCRDIGVAYWSPHTFVLEESGMFSPDGIKRIVAFKKQTDPKGLLNPGKIGSN